MSGTKAGGMKAAATNKQRYGDDFYCRIGKKGGANGHTGGFAANQELARIAGKKGGSISRRGPAKNKVKNDSSTTVKMAQNYTPKPTEKLPTNKEISKQRASIRLWMRLFGGKK